MKTAIILSISFVVSLAAVAVLGGLVFLLVRLRDLERAEREKFNQNRPRYD